LAPTARLVGPLIVQRGATIGERATVIGPTVIGAGVMVGDDAVVAQSVVLDGAEVTADSIVRGGVVSGNGMLHVTQATPTAGAAAGRMSINQVTLSGKRTPRRIGRPIFPAIKRGLDFIVALLLLLFLAPLWPLIFLAIKLDSAGPVFFLHSREGLDGREFGCIKFRTMRADADQIQRELADANVVDGPQFKIDDDPRITRVGKWLRLSNIDELPQLINVLRGEMSLVGPRPSPFRENQICAPWRRARLSVRPGITGLWQICRADRDEGDFHQWIYYDVLYVRHFSFRLDVKILLATLTSLGGHRRIPITRIVNLRRYDHATGDFPAALPT
jgi:lipopolysaccharide/colanic/teichoic acid biosynthesis glycosyltransferase